MANTLRISSEWDISTPAWTSECRYAEADTAEWISLVVQACFDDSSYALEISGRDTDPNQIDALSNAYGDYQITFTYSHDLEAKITGETCSGTLPGYIGVIYDVGMY
jgi:hypothetical protein